MLSGQNTIQFPVGSRVVDVTKSPYNAAGDGVSDDTDAINQALADHNDGQYIIYLPEGTYLISDTLKWGGVNDGEQATRYTILQGESKLNTVIKIEDNSSQYNDGFSPRPLIWTGVGAAQRFRNAIRNLTVNVGSNNPGAIGIQFKANNQGGIFNVDVISEDGQGSLALDFKYSNEIGPMIVKNVFVDGFDRAIQTNFNVNSITMEHIHIQNQNIEGILVKQQVVNIRKLKSVNSVLALRSFNQGSHVLLVDSELINPENDNTGVAVRYGSSIFMRNVTTNGYETAVQFNLNGTTPIEKVQGPYVNEFVSDDGIIRICDNEEESLNLPVKETPTTPYGDSSLWVNIEDFGAIKGDNIDDSQAFINAFATGASIIYVPNSSFKNGSYQLDQNVTVPPEVRMVIGCEGNVNGSGKLLLESGSDTFFLERFNSIGSGVIHNASRVLVIKNTLLRTNGYSGTSTSDVYLEDVLVTESTFTNKNVWARQLNMESSNVGLTNDGGNLWILGYKTEKRGVRLRTINSGKTEILGAHIYSISAPTSEFMFEVIESSLSLACVRETNFAQNPYENLIKEVRNGVTHTLSAGSANFGIGGSGFPLYIGFVSSASNQAPQVNAGSDIHTILSNEVIEIDAQINDDGLPSGNCFTALLWEPIGNPFSFSISDANISNPEITFDTSGVFQFRLGANDGDVISYDTIAIYVYDNVISTGDHNRDGTASGIGADSYIYRTQEDNNFGGLPTLPIRRSGNVFHRVGVLRFDLNQTDLPLKSAGIALEIAETNTGLIKDRPFNVFALKELPNYGGGELGEFWEEGTSFGNLGTGDEITWANAPGLLNSGGGVYDSNTNSGGGVDNSMAIFVGRIIPRNGVGEVLYLSNNILTDFINEDNNGVVTFYITGEVSTNQVLNFASKENPTLHPPRLFYANKPMPCPYVWNSDNSGIGSLRHAIDCTDQPSVLFSKELKDTIQLEELISISKNIEINGSEAENLIINSRNGTGLFNIQMGQSLSLQNCELVGGASIITNNGLLNLTQVEIHHNDSSLPGPINNNGQLIIKPGVSKIKVSN